MKNASRRSRCILFIHSRKRLTTTGERKGVQDGNTIPGSSISRSGYEPGIREVTNNQLVTQTLVFPRCRLVRDFLIPELSYYKALLPLPRPFASFLLTVAVVVANTVYKPNRISLPMVTFSARLFRIFSLSYSFTHFFLFVLFLSFYIFPGFRDSFDIFHLIILWIYKDHRKARKRTESSLPHARMISIFECFGNHGCRGATVKNHQRQWQECRQEFCENA